MTIAKPQPLSVISSNLDADNLTKLSDNKISTQAQNGTDTVSITLGVVRQNVLSLSNLEADAVNITLYGYADTVLEEKNISLLYAEITDIWGYFYASYLSNDELMLRFDIQKGVLKIKIDIFKTAQVAKVGNLLLGEALSIGVTDVNFKSGIRDFSLKEADEFGDTFMVERGFVKRGNFTIYVLRDSYSKVLKYLSQIRAMPVLFMADDNGLLEGAVMYGIFKDFEFLYSYSDYVVLEIEIEQLY